MFKVEFDTEVSRIEDPDGTQHITIKPVLLTKVSSLDRNVDTLFALKGKGLAYAVAVKSWGGHIYNEGDQILYTNIALYSLREGSAPEDLQIIRVVGSPQLFYAHEQSWVAGEHRDYPESEKSRIKIAFVGHDPLFEEILSRLDRKENPPAA